mgnify:CR=1 FL=1
MAVASTIIARLRDTLLDEAAVVWSDDDLLQYISEAQRQIVFLKNDALPIEANLPLFTGVSQRLPLRSDDFLDGLCVIDVLRNYDNTNELQGRSITLVDKELLDETNRFWPTATQTAEVDSWAADPRDPRRFLVSPPNDGTGYVTVLYGAIPGDLIASDVIELPDAYVPSIIYYALAQAYGKNSLKGDLVKSNFYTQQFMQGLGIKAQSQIAVAPKVSESSGM